ncbi:MAG: DUF1800 domain-containing protein [Betaproteobacteria bacterium]|nr:MAG: DUF1800 domain-containing protein [Betaproteobacteria bacterium]
MRRDFTLALLLFIGGCATQPQTPASRAPLAPIAWPDDSPALELAVLNRVSWGANRSSYADIARLGTGRWLDAQLRPPQGEVRARLPAEAQAAIDAMTISQRPIAEIAAELEQQRRAFQNAAADDRKAERQAYQESLGRLGREAQTRMLLRALYSPNQLEEQMTWFWMNHFSVFQFKGPLRALVADYEERAVRPQALGRFRELLGATARHPAMLIYLDNARNSAGRINENYARELMELHTLGVDGGYTQSDVEALARILTGWSLDLAGGELSRFYPRRHDFGDKVLLGRTIRGRGAAELDEALDILARHPSTARFVSRKLATFLVADEPPAALVERMAQTFSASDGDIAQVLRTLFVSPEFRASLGGKFKDPQHYALSALRLVLDQRPLPDAQPVIGALARMGEPLYARATPDGYPLTRTDWASPGQLATRFEIARGIAYRVPVRIPMELVASVGDATRETLAKAASPQEWNLLLLSSPEFMQR